MKNSETSFSEESDLGSADATKVTKETTDAKDAKDEPFLRRWSKRKLAASNSDEQTVAVTQQSQLSTERQQTEYATGDQVAEEPEKELTDEDMPPIETLDENSDFSGFFSPKVSDTLRRQALRKLFHFQQFNITDGLNDYDEDYTKFEKLGNTVTHDMKRLLERETKALREKDSVEESEQGATIDDISHHKDNERNDTIVERNEITAEANEEDTETGNELI